MSGTFGQTVTVTAKLTLTAGGAAVAGKPVLHPGGRGGRDRA